MLFDEVDESVDGFVFGNVEFHRFFADVEVDLAGGASDVAEVSIGHLSRSVDDAAHHRDANSFEVSGRFANALGRCLEVKERATTAGTGDIVGFENAGSAGLENVVGKAERLSGCLFALNEDGVSYAVTNQRTDIRW